MTTVEQQGSPQSGYPAAAIAVSPGVLATIPYPTNIPPGPVPTVLPYIVIVNSSPYSLLVSQGMVLTQIPAFTADSVRVPELGSGLTGVTILPQVGLVQPALGSDSTVYATWYANTPPGTYPSAIGAGAIRTIIADQIIPDATNVIVNAGVGVASLGPFDVSAFSQVRLAIGADNTNGGPMGVLMQWATSTGGPTSPQFLILPRGAPVPITGGPPSPGFIKADFPVRGEQLTIFFFNDFGGVLDCFVNLSGSTVPGGAGVSFGLTGPARNLPGVGNLIGSINTACPGAGATTLLGESAEIYGGPVSVVTNMGATWNATAGDLLRIETQDTGGGWTSFSPAQNIFPTAGPMFTMNFFVPPVPLRIRFTNAAAGAVTPSIWMTPDPMRN